MIFGYRGGSDCRYSSFKNEVLRFSELKPRKADSPGSPNESTGEKVGTSVFFSP